MYSGTTPIVELLQRIGKLQEVLQAQEVGGALIVQKTDLFYFSGTSQQGWLYVPDSGAPLLMIFKDFERACSESALENIISLDGVSRIPAALAETGYDLPPTLGMELDVLPVNLYRQYAKGLRDVEIVDLSYEIRLVRAVKSAYEQELIREAAHFSDKVASMVPNLLEPGRTEVEVAGELEAYARRLGHQGIVRMRLWGSELFYGHLMSGSDAAVPSYLSSPTGGNGVSPVIGQGAGFKRIERDEPVLVDYVFGWKGYLSDHSRIFCVGNLPDELARAHDAMLEIQEKTRAWGIAGAVCGELYEKMLRLAKEKGYENNFMGVGAKKIRFTGHGIGLELDEFPFIARGQKSVLVEGMIVALEPKVIFPGLGVMGIENTHVVTERGLSSLTHYPDTVVYL